jgi:hypothetical protein
MSPGLPRCLPKRILNLPVSPIALQLSQEFSPVPFFVPYFHKMLIQRAKPY